jgi:hypothetical protein
MSSGPPPKDKASEREAKRAQALRANLRRRKAARPPPPSEAPSDPPADPGDGDCA